MGLTGHHVLVSGGNGQAFITMVVDDIGGTRLEHHYCNAVLDHQFVDVGRCATPWLGMRCCVQPIIKVHYIYSFCLFIKYIQGAADLEKYKYSVEASVINVISKVISKYFFYLYLFC